MTKRKSHGSKVRRDAQRQRLERVADQILGAFERGDVPKAAAKVFLAVDDRFPSASWSIRNRFIVAVTGASATAGFRQWQGLGRTVKKGERAFHILRPAVVRLRDEEEDDEKTMLVGFRPVPVFGLHQTEGEPIEDVHCEHLDGLPLVEVARSWSIRLASVERNGKFLAQYRWKPDGTECILLTVENVSAWAHELVHAADRRCVGKLAGGQHADQEVVAQLGASVLLECLGRTEDADHGGSWRYIEKQVASIDEPEKRRRRALDLCSELLDRTLAAVGLILSTAAEVDARAWRGPAESGAQPVGRASAESAG